MSEIFRILTDDMNVLSRQLLSIVVFLALCSYVLTSSGDIDPAFRSCSWRCYHEDDCENKIHLYQEKLRAFSASTSATFPAGGFDYANSHKIIWKHLMEAYFYYTEPHCLEICSYKCAWNMTQERLSQDLPVLKYHGHWVFQRPLGYDVHEVSSSVFSVANAIPHLLQIAKQLVGCRYNDGGGDESVRSAATARAGYWGDYYLASWIAPYPYVAAVTWLSSAAYHARRTRASTTLDLCTALVLLSYGLLITVRRVLGPLVVFGRDFRQQVLCCNYASTSRGGGGGGDYEGTGKAAVGHTDGCVGGAEKDALMAKANSISGDHDTTSQSRIMGPESCAALLFYVVRCLPFKPVSVTISTDVEFDEDVRKQMQWRYVFVQLRVVFLNAMLLIGLPLLVWRLHAMSVSSTISFSDHMTLAIPLAAVSSAIWTVWALTARDSTLSADEGRPVIALSQSSLISFVSFDHGGSRANRVRMLLFQCWFMLAAMMEIFDFPPLFGLFDAHSLWHACTVPLGFFWYKFLRVDASTRVSTQNEIRIEGIGKGVNKEKGKKDK